MATIIPTNSLADSLGTPTKPWASVATKTIRLPSQNQILDTTDKLYSTNGSLYFDGNQLLTEAEVLGTTEWVSEDVIMDAIHANGPQITLDNQIKQVNQNYQVRVLLNGLELASDEFVVELDHKTLTLSLPNQLYPLESGSVFKIWYIKA